ncbi:phosphoglycerate kinase [Candidatus Peregrinibacteria bacterium HGW-Peregrinibacteria-1]|jgi:phosphoglycerate kinase|nr:MAG: phosphoglycerate kinase [Candidatus Peregrinibacteria bacterium HGW-Peregrinibacteria-1]
MADQKKLRSISDVNDLEGKRVLLRCDLNVPLSDSLEVVDDTRIVESLDTINYLIAAGAIVIIVTHLGRPGGKVVEELRLGPVAKVLEARLKRDVLKLDEAIGVEVEAALGGLKPGSVALLENIRFYSGEESNDSSFSAELARLADIFVSDGFGVVHREHSSVHGVASYLPAYSGFLIDKEVRALSPIVEGKYRSPLAMIFGGAKMDTKIGVMKNFVGVADTFLVGGALANTFLAAKGVNVGRSLYEPNEVATAIKIMEACEGSKTKIILPVDVVVADSLGEDVGTDCVGVEEVGDRQIFDIGLNTAENFKSIVSSSQTVIWNGPLGVNKYEIFRKGSDFVLNSLVEFEGVSILGGGDTIDCMKAAGFESSDFTHVSTGGGACLEYLSGLELPGLKVLCR